MAGNGIAKGERLHPEGRASAGENPLRGEETRPETRHTEAWGREEKSWTWLRSLAVNPSCLARERENEEELAQFSLLGPQPTLLSCPHCQPSLRQTFRNEMVRVQEASCLADYSFPTKASPSSLRAPSSPKS